MNSFTEPNADARQLATSLRQMYVALIDQGFNEQQAMELLQRMLANSSTHRETE